MSIAIVVLQLLRFDGRCQTKQNGGCLMSLLRSLPRLLALFPCSLSPTAIGLATVANFELSSDGEFKCTAISFVVLT